MGEHARIDQGFGRRHAPRVRLDMPARLITPEGTCPVMLENMSAGGAKIVLPEPVEFVVCVLRWMDRHAFADVVWREGAFVGVKFNEPISVETLEATCRYAENLVRMRQGGPGLRSC